MAERISRWRAFFSEDLWSVELHQRWARPHQRAFLCVLRVGRLATAGSGLGERLQLRAAALTYSSLLSVVPLLSVVFALFAAFGGLEALRAALQTLVEQHIEVAERARILTYLDHLIATSHAGALGATALVLLALTAISMLSTIEQALNFIWGVKERRSFGRRLQRYWPVLILGPMLLVASVSGSASLQSTSVVRRLSEWFPWAPSLVSIASFLLGTVALFVAYRLMPNTSVQVSSALVGALTASLLFEVAKRLYALWARQALTYSTLYGSLAFVPLTILWVYVSWLVALTGASVSFAHQHAASYQPHDAAESMSPRARLRLAALLMMKVHASFLRGRGPAGEEALLSEIPAPHPASKAMLSELEGAQLLFQVERDVGGTAYLPGRAPETTTLADVERCVLGPTDDGGSLSEDPAFLRVIMATNGDLAGLAKVTFRELVEGSRASPAGS